MEQPLTPPPSFRVLRVRPRTRTRTVSDENMCNHVPPIRTSDGFAVLHARSRKDISTSPSRGRTRSRVVRNGLTLNTNNHTRPHLSLTLPPCCSPPPSRSDTRSPGRDDDLIFQMSPIQAQSPTSICFDAAQEVNADTSRVEQSTMQTLSALWEKHKASVTTAASQSHAPRTPCRRARAGTVTQHQRGFSDTHANILPRREWRREHRPQQSAKALFDLPLVLQEPLTPTSPPPAEPFMYSFPSFESSPLVKARQARARRQASQAFMRGEYMTGGLELESTDGGADSSLDVEIENPYPQRLGPIRARKLRIQSGESLSDDVDDANFISHAFQSASLDPEKESDLDADDDTGALDDGYYSSQRSSSVSSSSTTDITSLNHSNVLSSSLLASFPVRPSSRSRTHSSSSSRPHSRRTSPSKVRSEASANAMMTRGRASRRTSAEVQQASAAYVGGDRRGRGRTPASTRRSGSDMHIPAAVAWTSMR